MKVHKIPKVATMMAFLKVKGFTIAGENKLFYVMKPPPSMKFEGDFQFFIPRHEQFKDYSKVVDLLLNSFSQLFEINVEQLRELLSQDIQTIKENAEIGARMAAFAA